MDGGTIEIPFGGDYWSRDRGVEWIELRDVVWTGGGLRPAAIATMKIVGPSGLATPSRLPDSGIIFGAGDGDDTIRTPDHAPPAERFSMVFGNGGDDRIVLSSDGSYRAFGGPGRDTILARGDGQDTLCGDDGRDTLRGAGESDDLRGGRGDDALLGGAGADSLAGEGGDDLLRGGQGDDRLGGEILVDRFALPVTYHPFGDDTLFGGPGADTLAGGYGSNRVTGGADADLFIVWYGGGIDTVTDFEVGVDVLFVECDTCGLEPRAVVRDGNTLIRMGGQTEAVLLGVEATLDQLLSDLG
jgi:hypothetical protein